MLKKYALPCAILYTIALTIASLIKTQGIPEFGTNYDDKIYHILAYILLTLAWYFALIEKKIKYKVLYIVCGCITFGIVIEALQGKLTAHRVGDALDVVANTIGVLLALFFIFITKKRIS